MKNAKKFIYITGWSVDTNITLLRREGDGNNGFLTIGDLLTMKAEEGVAVRILIWNEATSMSMGDEQMKQGLMFTHDEETVARFASTKVKCHAVYRLGSTGSEYLWSHHQKSIILDTDCETEESRRIIAFVGGLDLCDGRWDTPGHTLFRSLQQEHSQDFHNPLSIKRAAGPREPWHDIHSKLEGPIALDVMSNFEQRWNKQVGTPQELYDLEANSSSFLGIDQHNKFEKTNSDSEDSDSEEEEEREQGNSHVGQWCVQLFRSITPDSATITSNDASIQHGYINAIRNARRFIYIENQYFMGSSFAWSGETDVGSNNRIPFEIATKIASRILKKKDFSVYIVVPMFPEGDPVTNAVQEMLHWQWKTMEMMYRIVAKAIRDSKNKDAKPTDYLNFYCLGNRENLDGDAAANAEAFVPGTYSDWARQKRRFMIYVHAKMMIVDDEFIIVGSANINERSMAGDRDTEIAIGAYEENQSYAKFACGSVHNFRKSLWAEHLGLCDPYFLTPESAETARKVKAAAMKNWEEYIGDDIIEMVGHLLPYPVTVRDDGSITPLIGQFPDTPARVEGAAAVMVPNLLTQ
eukprot:TRINITY_DN10934_c0_g1_i2.p1 TRINITY_DN10934_c0_g1~~TRINITY_DN10934_c0_g1_i2.p1  ORF type:complete len:579 (-),score=94.53 TRINITY_DN10934_c0_g1_i2:21-1757(-)